MNGDAEVFHWKGAAEETSYCSFARHPSRWAGYTGCGASRVCRLDDVHGDWDWVRERQATAPVESWDNAELDLGGSLRRSKSKWCMSWRARVLERSEQQCRDPIGVLCCPCAEHKEAGSIVEAIPGLSTLFEAGLFPCQPTPPLVFLVFRLP